MSSQQHDDEGNPLWVVVAGMAALFGILVAVMAFAS
jgi:hypothetical protein